MSKSQEKTLEIPLSEKRLFDAYRRLGNYLENLALLTIINMDVAKIEEAFNPMR